MVHDVFPETILTILDAIIYIRMILLGEWCTDLTRVERKFLSNIYFDFFSPRCHYITPHGVPEACFLLQVNVNCQLVLRILLVKMTSTNINMLLHVFYANFYTFYYDHKAPSIPEE